MVNTYPDNASMETKIYEEKRCTRAVLERILRVMDESLFVDYQMEKFGKAYKTAKHDEGFETIAKFTQTTNTGTDEVIHDGYGDEDNHV